MSPEQAAGRLDCLGPATDIYSLGATLYAILVGRPPVGGESSEEVLQNARCGRIVSPRKVNDGIPRALEAICLRALALEPRDRYSTALELAEDLEHWLADESVVAYREPLSERTRRWMRRHPTLVRTSAATLVVLVLTGLIFSAILRNIREREEINGLVNALMQGRSDKVPGTLSQLAVHGHRAEVQLREAASDANDSVSKLRSNLGLLALGDLDCVSYLQECIYSANSEELPLLLQRLAPHSLKLVPELWAILQDESADNGRRFRAACALSEFDPGGQGWDHGARYVVRQLVDPRAAEIGLGVAGFRRIGDKLVPRLRDVLADRRAVPGARARAAAAFAVYAKPADIVDAIVEVEGDELRMLLDLARQCDRELAIARLTSFTQLHLTSLEVAPLDAAAPRREAATPAAYVDTPNRVDGTRVMLASSTAEIPSADKDENRAANETREIREAADARRLANAAGGLLLFKQDGPAWEVFRTNARPTARSMLIQLCAKLNVASDYLSERLMAESDTSMRSALIYSLGNYASSDLPSDVRAEVIAYLLKSYREDPDAGVHGAAVWTLLQWQQGSELTRIDAELASQSADQWTLPPVGARSAGWHVNSQKQTFAIVSPHQFQIGSPTDETGRNESPGAFNETRSSKSLDYTFALGVKEITNQEFARFVAANPGIEQPEPASDRYSPDPLGPRPGVNWFMAARYCRWLSEQEEEHIPESERCFPPLDQIHAGMTLPADWHRRTGYRLPTDREWECACRAGTTTARYYGEGVELLDEYAWYGGNNPMTRAYIGAQKKANDFGIFDLYGNGFEWCMDVVDPLFDGGLEVVSARSQRFARGGGMSSPPNELRSAQRTSFEASRAGYTVVFRLARTLPVED